MKVLIIEDELPAQRILKDMLGELKREIEIVGCLNNVKTSVEWFKNHPHPEIVLLDIQLSDGISFDILKQVTIESMIIFVTAFDKYAIQAFKVNSIDYLLKPIDLDELENAFKKYDNYSSNFLKTKNKEINYEEILSAIKNSKPNYRNRFLIHSNESFYQLPVSEISYFYSSNKITFAVTFEKRKVQIDSSLENLIEQLNPEQFFKINRQFIVNMEAIEKVNMYFGGKLIVQTKPQHSEKIIVGKDKAASFKRWLEG